MNDPAAWLRVSLTTSGGFAAPILGRRPPRVVATDDLDDDAAGTLRSLVADVVSQTSADGAQELPRDHGGGGGRGADAVGYRVRVDMGPEPVTSVAWEADDVTISAPLARLVEFVESHEPPGASPGGGGGPDAPRAVPPTSWPE